MYEFKTREISPEELELICKHLNSLRELPQFIETGCLNKDPIISRTIIIRREFSSRFFHYEVIEGTKYKNRPTIPFYHKNIAFIGDVYGLRKITEKD